MDIFKELAYCLKPVNDQSNLDRLSEEELTPAKTLDPYEYAVIEAEKLLRTSDSAVTAIEVIHRLAELEKQRQTGVMLDETFKKKQ